MKRLLSLILVIPLLLCSCAGQTSPEVSESSGESLISTTRTYKKSVGAEEMRGVWISCYELPSAKNGEEKFREDISAMFSNVAEFGLNTVFVHVRPFADAVYPSELFPWSKYVCSSSDPGFDPLKVMVEEAKTSSLALHAWINPFRVSLSNDISALPQNSPARASEGSEKTAEGVAVIESGIYLNPASPRAHKLIFDGVREILENYDVAGIHIDDYFYPCKDESLDSELYSSYKAGGGLKSLDDWRRDSVNAFAAGLYSLVKSYGEELVFSISPAGNPAANRDALFADTGEWLSREGYADVIIPQLYFGFENSSMPFEATAKLWSKAAECEEVRVAWGLAAYKIGEEDKNAGEGSKEWQEHSDILARQLTLVRSLERCDGFVLFSYSYIFDRKFNKNLKKEMQSLKNML